jgi:hypothetical protein
LHGSGRQPKPICLAVSSLSSQHNDMTNKHAVAGGPRLNRNDSLMSSTVHTSAANSVTKFSYGMDGNDVTLQTVAQPAAPPRGRLVPLRTRAEVLASTQFVNVYIVQLPTKQNSQVLAYVSLPL